MCESIVRAAFSQSPESLQSVGPGCLGSTQSGPDAEGQVVGGPVRTGKTDALQSKMKAADSASELRHRYSIADVGPIERERVVVNSRHPTRNRESERIACD